MPKMLYQMDVFSEYLRWYLGLDWEDEGGTVSYPSEWQIETTMLKKVRKIEEWE